MRHHPDKASPEQKDEAHKKFQEVAFAYAILSDDRRRKRYDTTGNTTETLDDDDFDWADFFRSQTEQLVNGDMIDKIKREYQGSEEEHADLLKSYEKHEGDMDAVYEEIMCSNVLDDDERFRRIIDQAVNDGKVEAYSMYTKETKASRKKRIRRAKHEEVEAMEMAEELGVKDKLFGTGVQPSNGKKGRPGKNGGDEDALKSLIQQRQESRGENFFDRLESKYAGGGKKKRKVEEPPEEMFQKNAKKANKSKTR